MSVVRLLAILATGSSLSVPPAQVVAVDFSRPVLEFDCTLHDRKNNGIDFAFRVSGGRMVLKDGKLAGYTPRKIEVLRDPAALTSRFPDQYVNMAREFDDTFEASFGWDEKDSFQGGLSLKTFGVGRENTRVVALHDGFGGSFAAAGLCDVKKLAQRAIQEGSAN